MTMDVVVTYDVNTETKAGRRRLRQVAKACESFGQRVQWSVFECTVSDAQLERLLRAVETLIDGRTDSLRVYRLMGGRRGCVTVLGIDRFTDFAKPLVY